MGKHKPASTPHFRVINLSAEVKKSWGPEYNQRDVVYRMGSGREYLSTNKTNSGIYKND